MAARWGLLDELRVSLISDRIVNAGWANLVALPTDLGLSVQLRRHSMPCRSDAPRQGGNAAKFGTGL